jgi:hypothetical protein
MKNEGIFLGKYIFEKIINVNFDDDCIILSFDNGTKLTICDGGQCCCESRYMTTDDDVNSLVGGLLLHIDLKDGPDEEDTYGDVHEIQFLEISTDKAFVTIANHNEHNGYYGGFAIQFYEGYNS